MHTYSKYFLLALVFSLLTHNSYAQKKTMNTTLTQSQTITESKTDYGTYDFAVTTLDGKLVHLSDFSGKVVLVNIWAPWCGPCRAETPGFVQLYKKYHQKGFEIVSVAVSTTEGDVQSFVEKQGIKWNVGLNDDVASQYGTRGIPDNFLFDKDGTLLKRFVGYTRESDIIPLLEKSLH